MSSDFFTNKTILKILDHYQSAWALSHLLSLSAWDSEVYMPEKGTKYRGIAQAKTQTLIQNIVLDSNFQELIKKADDENLNIYEESIIRLLKRETKFYKSLPAKFLEEFEHTTSRALLSWRKAKEQDNFDLFSDDLSKIILLSRQKADYLGYESHKYNALLDQYEEGSSVEELDVYFEDVVKFIEELLKKIVNSDNYKSSHPLSNTEYPIELAKTLNLNILKILKYDPGKISLDISSHPFSEGLSTDDSRITTRYEGFDIARTITSTIHEYGHALYFLQHQEAFNTTPLYTGYSLGLHESQSRFFENHIGRSKEFINKLSPLLHKLSRDYEKFDANEFYKYFNLVTPSLIRVESDEVTYHGHIYIRYSIEKKLINGEIEAKDVPEVWNKHYEEVLGVTPKTNQEGCLQDIHWSMGAIGYFPTYSQGTVFAAAINERIAEDIGNMSDLIHEGKIDVIQKWLFQNIHQYGATYIFEELSKKLTGEKFVTEPWKRYLSNKYSDIYNIID